MKKKTLLLLPVLGYLAYRFNANNSTTKIEGDNAISEMKEVEVNGAKLAVMIRGRDKNNPVLLCVTGGPCGTDIPLLKKYEKDLEEKFTVVHYDQRGAGKSFYFDQDYKDLTYQQHVDDLITLTEYLKDYLDKDQVYLLGHSYGTYLGSLAADQRPDLYKAYIGIGQMSDTAHAEYYSLLACIEAAKEKGNDKDVKYLESIREKVENGEMMTPRKYVRKYKFAEREDHGEMKDLFKNVIFGPEYNILDGIKFYYSAMRNSMALAMQSVKDPLPSKIKENKVPTYFILGKYDGMTNTKAAREFFDSLGGNVEREFIVFENSAHSPQIEENEKFVKWMCNDFLAKNS